LLTLYPGSGGSAGKTGKEVFSRDVSAGGVHRMLEQGVVRKIISPDTVEVSLKKTESCHKCRACNDDGAGAVSIEAGNAAGAKVGDCVEIEIPTGGVVAASSIVYLLPIAFLLAGYLCGSLWSRFFYDSDSEGLGVLCALAFLAASFVAVRHYDRRVRRRGSLRAQVLRILIGPEGV